VCLEAVVADSPRVHEFRNRRDAQRLRIGKMGQWSVRSSTVCLTGPTFANWHRKQAPEDGVRRTDGQVETAHTSKESETASDSVLQLSRPLPFCPCHPPTIHKPHCTIHLFRLVPFVNEVVPPQPVNDGPQTEERR
jgi:hypothetical protein